MLTTISALLPLLLSYVLFVTPTLHLQQDVEKDLARLQEDKRYFISDNSTFSPSAQTVTSDLQLFQVKGALDLSKASHSSETLGNHQIDVWQFPEGDIKKIYQIESKVHLDTVVTQRYLDQRTPTQQRITNDFTFRSYLITTASEPSERYYLTEKDQGLLSYHLGEKQVEINYAGKKEGLSDILPKHQQEVKEVLEEFQREQKREKEVRK